MNPRARELLGDEIYFAQRIPWIWGKIDSLHGIVDIEFSVKGTKSTGLMKFKCTRPKGNTFFQTDHWNLQLENGTVIDLIGHETTDPMVRSDLPTAENPGLLAELRAGNANR